MVLYWLRYKAHITMLQREKWVLLMAVPKKASVFLTMLLLQTRLS